MILSASQLRTLVHQLLMWLEERSYTRAAVDQERVEKRRDEERRAENGRKDETRAISRCRLPGTDEASHRKVKVYSR